MGILNILLYVLLIYMVYRSYTLSKKTKKNRELINIIVHAEDPDTYFEQLDAYTSFRRIMRTQMAGCEYR